MTHDRDKVCRGGAEKGLLPVEGMVGTSELRCLRNAESTGWNTGTQWLECDVR